MQASDSAESGTGPYFMYFMLTTIKSTTRQINPNQNATVPTLVSKLNAGAVTLATTILTYTMNQLACTLSQSNFVTYREVNRAMHRMCNAIPVNQNNCAASPISAFKYTEISITDIGYVAETESPIGSESSRNTTLVDTINLRV